MADDIDSLLNAGVLAARAGNKSQARRLMEQVLEKDDSNERAWLVLASVVDTPRERRICLENVLELNPNNQQARQALEKLTPSPPSERGIAASAARELTPKPVPPTTPLPPPQSRDPVPASKASVVPRAPVRTATSSAAWRGVTSAPRRQRTLGLNPIFLVAAALSLLLILVGVVLIVGTPATPTPTPIPTRHLSAAQIAASSFPQAVTATVFIPTTDPSIVTSNAIDIVPTWTPSITPLPPPSFTPIPTLPPFADYTLAYISQAVDAKVTKLYTITADGKNAKLLIDSSVSISDPAWSPNGKKIAYISPVGDKQQIFVANADGSQPQAITKLSAPNVHSPAWSPDSSHLAFVSDATGNNEIYTIKVDGSEQTQITDNKKYDNLTPAWSPDGTRIACAIDTTGRKAYQIYLIDLTTKTPTKLTDSQGSNYNPAWSPDGTRIAFDSTRNRASKIFVMRADGTDPQMLTYGDFTGATEPENREPAWSPDGNLIAFTSTRNAGIPNLFLMTPDGQNIQQITNAAGSSTNGKFRPNTF